MIRLDLSLEQSLLLGCCIEEMLKRTGCLDFTDVQRAKDLDLIHKALIRSIELQQSGRRYSID